MTRIDPRKRTETQLKTQKQKPQTRAEEMRALLKTLENRLSKLSDTPADQVMEVPSIFDQIDRALDELQDLGMNLSSEQGQIDTLSARFNKNLALFIRRIGGPQVLESMRQEIQPSPDRWWWYADLTLAAQNRQKRIRWLRLIGTAAVVLIILSIVYKIFLAPDPILQESFGHQQRAENALIGGEFEEALAEIQQAISLTPDDPRLHMMKGVIQEALGLSEDALGSFDAALHRFDREDQFYNERTTIYLMMSEPERALADIEIALQLNPNSAISYLHQGNAYEMLGDIPKAIESLEKADELAQQSGNAQLQAIIRISLSTVYQNVTLPTSDGDDLGDGE
jgi:tetratricopeptide (TPR) repeat protein